MELNAQQRRVRDAFLRESARKGASPKKVKALLEAGLVEANLGNPNYGDRDSIGSLQERSHYGSAKRRLNPVLAARRFLTEAEQLDRPQYSAGELAQAVQRSAFPDRYDKRGKDAEALLAGGAVKKSAAAKARPIPGVDRSADRQALVSSYFANSHDKGALIGLAMGLRNAKDTPARTVKATAAGGAPSPTASAAGLTPRGRYAGTGGPMNALFNEIAKPLGLKATSRKRFNTNPASGSRSDHDHGNKDAYAIDMSDGSKPTPAMDEAAYRFAKRLGVKGYKKGAPLVQTVSRDGIRYQLLYRTNTGGNHFNHLHVGAKRVR